MDVTEATARRWPTGATPGAAGFERLYRANVGAVTAYFARRTADPHVVADLTAEVFVTAITGFGSFDPGKGSAKAWVLGIAHHVYAAHCRTYGQQRDRLQRAAGRRELQPDEIGELLDRIDAEREGRELLDALHRLPDRDRELIELVDLAGLRPKEAAAVLTVTSGAARMRLLRARAQLRQHHRTTSPTGEEP